MPSTRPTKWKRRAILSGIGIGLTGAGAGFIYKQSPFFWKQYARELGQPIDPPRHKPQPKSWPDTGLHATWIGHASVLLKLDGYTIITDPVFSSRVGIGLGPITLGLKRLVQPALSVEELPRIDLVLLSHAHMDHFDIPSLRALESKKVEVVTARGTSDLLRPDRYHKVQEVSWGQTTQSGPAAIRGLQVNHWGARMRSDTWRGYNGYVITAGRWRVVFGGDTAVVDTFRQVGGADLALMPIGAYNPWIRVHCDPEQAWRMSEDARAAHVLPIHHATFNLSHEPVHEPVERLLQAAGSQRSRVALTDPGQEFHLS